MNKNENSLAPSAEVKKHDSIKSVLWAQVIDALL